MPKINSTNKRSQGSNGIRQSNVQDRSSPKKEKPASKNQQQGHQEQKVRNKKDRGIDKKVDSLERDNNNATASPGSDDDFQEKRCRRERTKNSNYKK